MISAKHKNIPVVKMYRDDKQPYIETVITIRSPLRSNEEMLQNFRFRMDLISEVLDGMNKDVEEIVGDTFEADVVEVYSVVKNLLNN